MSTHLPIGILVLLFFLYGGGIALSGQLKCHQWEGDVWAILAQVAIILLFIVVLGSILVGAAGRS